MSYNRFNNTRERRLARIAKQRANTYTDITEEMPFDAEEVPLADEIIPIEEVPSVPVEQPELVVEEEVVLEEPIKIQVAPQVRSTQNVLDSIVGMLFAQHHQQIHKYMMELEKQIVAEQAALLKDKVDPAEKPE